MNTNETLQRVRLIGGLCDGQKYWVRPDQKTLTRPAIDPHPAKPGQILTTVTYHRSGVVEFDGTPLFVGPSPL